jgi:hypothetical protein
MFNCVCGQIAQSVEQRTENPCVPSSILGLAIFIHLKFDNILIKFLNTKRNVNVFLGFDDYGLI